MNEKTTAKFSEYQMFVFEKAEIDCIDVVKLMGDLHDQELSKSLAVRIDDHISSCSQCKKFADSYSAVVRLANELGQDQKPIPQPVKSRLRKALNERLGIKLSVHDGM